MGATNAVEAIPGTIRGDYVLENSFNCIYGSGEPETAVQEINLIFKPEELVNYSLDTDK